MLHSNQGCQMVRPYNFAPSRRIKRRGEFLEIQQNGKKVRCRFFVAAYKPLPAGSESRLGVTITTKVDKRAVRRNRLRRRIRDLFRHNCADFPYPAELVIIALNGATALGYPEIERELCYLFRKVKREDGR